jgi:rhodanese-related sulfurtransferase
MPKKTRIKFITKEELLEMMYNQDKFKLVEVLSSDAFKQGHLPNAINIPLNEIDKMAKELLKKDEKIVVYCASYACSASTNAAKRLVEMGYKKVFDYKGGKKDWTSAGLPLEK